MQFSNEVQSFIMLVVGLIITTFGASIAYEVFKFVRSQVKLVRSKLSEAQNAQLDVWVGIVVKAVEQANLKEGFEQTGEEKLSWAVDQLQTIANSWGFTNVSIAEWEARIRKAISEGWEKSAQDEVPAEPIQ